MDKTLIIGASGQIGTLLLHTLAELSLPTVAMVRNKQSLAANLQALNGIDIIEADLEKDISNAMRGCSTVIFTAGSGANTGLDKTLLVDLWGAAKAVDAAKASNVKHFIMVSSRGAANPDTGPAAIKPYCVAKHFADEHLIRSGVNYTILRPGRLTNAPIVNTITTEKPTDPELQFISREVTAQVITHCINNSAAHKKIYELYEGNQTILDAIPRITSN